MNLEERCKFRHALPESRDWGIIFLLCFLSIATFLKLTFLNIVSMQVFRKRVNKRSEARFLMMFCMLSGIDLAIGCCLTLRDIFYVFGECYKDGSKVLQSRKWLRIGEGYLMTLRSSLLALTQVYYLLVYLRPYQSEFIALRVVCLVVLLGAASIVSIPCDNSLVELAKCMYTNRWYETEHSMYISGLIMLALNVLSVFLIVILFGVSITGKGQTDKIKVRKSRCPPNIIIWMSINISVVGALAFLSSLEGIDRFKQLRKLNPTQQVIYAMTVHTALKFCLISLFFVYVTTLKYFWYEALLVMPNSTKR